MPPPGHHVDWSRYGAVLFDLDGVLTDTASLHASCWKRMFDEYLRRRADRGDEPYRAFETATDYRRFIDGKPRLDGVRSFLASRGIDLPEGGPEDPPGRETVHGLGNRKNALVGEALASEGVDVFPGSLRLVRYLRDAGIRLAVVSSSRNTPAVLRAADLGGLFEVRVDGTVAAERGLRGKPAPDTFLAATADLGVAADRAVVVEDALSGVAAGRAGRFGLVVGVDREGHREALLESGADLVVEDLGELVPG